MKLPQVVHGSAKDVEISKGTHSYWVTRKDVAPEIERN